MHLLHMYYTSIATHVIHINTPHMYYTSIATHVIHINTPHMYYRYNITDHVINLTASSRMLE